MLGLYPYFSLSYISDCTRHGSRSTIFSTVQGMVFVGLAIGPWVRSTKPSAHKTSLWSIDRWSILPSERLQRRLFLCKHQSHLYHSPLCYLRLPGIKSTRCTCRRCTGAQQPRIQRISHPRCPPTSSQVHLRATASYLYVCTTPNSRLVTI